MLIIEIILTVVAWYKGWKWLSLIPVGVALLLGVFVGMSVGLSGGTDVSGAIVIDILAIIALIVMCVKGKKEEPTKPTEPTV